MFTAFFGITIGQQAGFTVCVCNKICIHSTPNKTHFVREIIYFHGVAGMRLPLCSRLYMDVARVLLLTGSASRCNTHLEHLGPAFCLSTLFI